MRYPVLLLLLLKVGSAVAAVDLTGLPDAARAALAPAIVATTERFNDAEDHLREKPRIETSGPPEAPYMLRATYRRASAEHTVVAVEPGPPPTVTVRVRTIEMERRATRVSTDDLQTNFAKAPWKQSTRGWLLDFRLRWTGAAWEQVGEPTAHLTLNLPGARVGGTRGLVDSDR
jgi:hypothetical protein